MLGELLLEAGSTAAALASFGEAHRLAEGKAPRAAAGVALAAWHAGADPSVQAAATEEARRCGFAPSERLHLARLEIACGRLDEAEEARLHLVWHCLLSHHLLWHCLLPTTCHLPPAPYPLQAVELATKLERKRALTNPADGGAALTNLAQLGAEIEIAFYLEAIWPAEQPRRQARRAEAEADLPAALRIQPATLDVQSAIPGIRPAALCTQPATLCTQVRSGEAELPAGTEVAAWRLGRAVEALQALLPLTY